MPEWQFGIEWERDDGTRYIKPAVTEEFARHIVAVGQGFSPKPVRVMRRQPGEWQPADPEHTPLSSLGYAFCGLCKKDWPCPDAPKEAVS